MNIQLPPDFKRSASCKYRNRTGQCCNARNYLRPVNNSAYCVVKLDSWVRNKRPFLNEKDICKIVSLLIKRA